MACSYSLIIQFINLINQISKNKVCWTIFEEKDVKSFNKFADYFLPDDRHNWGGAPFHKLWCFSQKSTQHSTRVKRLSVKRKVIFDSKLHWKRKKKLFFFFHKCERGRGSTTPTWSKVSPFSYLQRSKDKLRLPSPPSDLPSSVNYLHFPFLFRFTLVSQFHFPFLSFFKLLKCLCFLSWLFVW